MQPSDFFYGTSVKFKGVNGYCIAVVYGRGKNKGDEWQCGNRVEDGELYCKRHASTGSPPADENKKPSQ